MNYLAIDTCNKNLSVVVCKNGEISTFFDPDCGVNHSVRLMPEIENLISSTGFDLKTADFIACVVGAGSFTGIRIGVSTAKALCFSNKIKSLKVTSFDAIAYNKKDGKVIAVINAGHGGYYVCAYDDLKVVIEPSYIDGEKLKELVKEYKPLSFEIIEGVETEVVSVLSGLIEAVNHKQSEATFDPDELTPVYIRKSQAEEGR